MALLPATRFFMRTQKAVGSGNILYAVLPFRRCTSRLIVTCGGIDTSRWTWSRLT